MDEDDILDARSTGSGSKDLSYGSGRVVWSRRPAGQGNRAWGRTSIAGLGSGRRRENEAKIFVTSRSSPRRLTLGGEGLAIGGTGNHGKHGIRYMQPLANMLEEEMSEEFKQDKENSDALASALPASPLFAQLSRLESETIAEESGSPGGDGGGDGEGGGEDVNRSKHGHRRINDARVVRLPALRIDNETEGRGSGALRPISPSSEARRGSASPSQYSDNRPRTQSWAPDIASPVLSGPFSRSRPRSRSPRHRFSMVLAPTSDGLPGLPGLPALQSEVSRLSSGGSEMTPALSKELSSGTVEEYLGWGGGDDEGDVAAEDARDGHGETRDGAFTDSALVTARLRLPSMDFGSEVDGFFGIDVRSLIIEREIARGAYGVVHEGVLLPFPTEDEGAVDGEDRTGADREADVQSNPEEDSGLDVDENSGSNAEGNSEVNAPPSEETNAKPELDEDEAGRAGTGGGVEVDAGGARGEDAAVEGDGTVAKAKAGVKRKEGGRKVAVKIQQVPEDEEEQANLLGELGVLRSYKHPHLVEFIGAAMAMERGADTVMVAMELCINGALREALKLNISWPLKIRIASDMTDGLQYLHQHGIIHRDIKTPNVLIDSFWRAKLCDYNFAIDEKSTIKQEFCAGTAEFMSPEVLLSEDYGLPSDVFSLGIIFVEMLTGKEPTAEFPQRPPQAFFLVNEEEIQAEILPDCPASFSLLQSQCLFEAPERPTAEDAHNWLQDLLNETGEEDIAIPQKEPPLPVLTQGAAIAREGNVINASPKVRGTAIAAFSVRHGVWQGSQHHWLESDAMEHQIGSMVENAVDRALAERGEHLGLSGLISERDDQNEARLEEMKAEIEALRSACEERDGRIADLEVQALRNTSTLKMLSSALEVAYKMLEAQQATLCGGNLELSEGVSLGLDGPAERNYISGQETDDVRPSRGASLAARV